jgi:CrcB protein
MSWQTILAIGSGGFLGAVARAYLNGLLSKSVETSFPIGTLGVNVLGSFILGSLFAYFTFVSLDIHLKSFLTTGLLGALTTFSTFAFETVLLLQAGNLLFAVGNIVLNVGLTVFSAWGGYALITHLKS